MNIIDAAHKTVHDYPGGSESLGPRIGMSPAVLRNKVNPNNTTHHLTLQEASEIVGVTGDHRILHALAAEHDYILARTDAGEGGNVLSLMLSASARKGEFAQLLHDSLKDGHITEREMRQLAGAGDDVKSAMVLLLRELRGMVGQRDVPGAAPRAVGSGEDRL